MDRRSLLLGLVAVSVVLGGWWTMRAEPEPPPLVDVAPAADGADLMTVHVAGAVVEPGVVSVAVGSRVVDAVAAAGGLLRDARTDGVNLAAPVRDGDQIVIPSADSEPADQDGRIRLNSAAAGDLEALPGVGPVLAARIISYREQHGAFATPEDLLDVPGIGEAKLASLRESILVP